MAFKDNTKNRYLGFEGLSAASGIPEEHLRDICRRQCAHDGAGIMPLDPPYADVPGNEAL